jgi:hypothetical protein
MERIITYKSIDGKMFDTEEECLKYENEWTESYKLLQTMKFYNEDSNPVFIPKLESFLRVGEGNSTREDREATDDFFNATHYVKFTNMDIFDETRAAYEKFMDRIGYMLDISSTKSVYGVYVYSDEKGYIPIDHIYKAAKREIFMMDRLIDGE